MNAATSQHDALGSHQRDLLQLNQQTNWLRELFSPIGPHHHQQQQQQHTFLTISSNQLQLVSRLLYYSLTTLLNRQTIGQECYNLIIYNARANRALSPRRRLLLVALRSISLVRLVELAFRSRLRGRLQSNRRSSSSDMCTLVKVILFYANEACKVAYLLDNTSYFDLIDWLVGVKFLSVVSRKIDRKRLDFYKMLGILRLVMLVMHVGEQVRSVYASEQRRRERQHLRSKSDTRTDELRDAMNDYHPATTASIKCLICLDGVRDPTVISSCGHLFCWHCIQRHASSSAAKPTCPSCRLEFSANRLVYLHNYM